MVKLSRFGVIFALSPLASLAIPQQFPLVSEDTIDHNWGSSLWNSTFHEKYRTLEETDHFIRELSHVFPNLVSVEPIGLSAEGRPMYALAISKPTYKKKNGERKLKKKPKFVIMGAQHAREWIATSTALYISHALLSNDTEQWSLNHLLDYFDFHVIPLPNPDGYNYTWDTDRFWYKDKMPVHEHTGCRGIDMNRNWGYGWEPSSSPSEGPCSAWYPGEKPFQAPEVLHLATYFQSLKNIMAFLDLRSYGQMISIPYSYNCDTYPPDAEDILEAAHGAASALKKVHGTLMKVGRLCETLYRAPGNVIDWMYAKNHVKFTYAIHLRDTGTYGYSLPSTWIRPVGEEAANLVSYLAKFIHEHLQLKKKKKKNH